MKVFPLICDEIKNLGQKAYEHHQDLNRWRETPYTTVEKTQISVDMKTCFEKQRQWVDALEELLDLKE